MIETAALSDFLASQFQADVRVLSHEPMFGGWNSSMSKVVAHVGEGPMTMVVRGDLSAANRLVTTDLGIEWAVLHALSEQLVRVAPAAYFADLTGEQLGEPAVFTEFVDGASLQFTVLSSPPETHDAHLDELARLAARIHSVDVASLAGVLEIPSSWDAYIDRRLAQWRELEAAWIERDPTMRYVAAWLADHRPPPLPLTLVHGDFHTSNTMVKADGSQLAVDWEFAHIGDPREDLGWTMLYESVSPPALVTERQERFCEEYRQLTGLGEEDINPAVLEWFSLINLTFVAAATLPASEAIVKGTSTSATLAMGIVMGVARHEYCLNLISSREFA
jgi:aminoglycoside phosphotransferase (APT) family kinase protein